MTDEVATVLAQAQEVVDPAPEERTALNDAIETLRERATAAITDRSVDAEVIHVGSTARDTWVSGDRDIDIFIRFPTTTDRSQLHDIGLAIGRDVLPDPREEYAEHPYVTGEFDGFDVDIVPCYDVPSAAEIRSAVDRTPFHDQYLSARLTPDLASDVRLVKGFCSGIGVYGSDLRTRGFSGYLTELLTLEYGGAQALLEATTNWTPPVHIDPEDHAATSFDDPLVVIDPTDPNRNVAAVLSAESLARFQHHARQFLADPALEIFMPSQAPSMTPATLRDHLDQRATTAVGIVFELPDLIEDDLYPQLRTSRRSVVAGLERAGFDVFRATADAVDRTGILLLELAVDCRPAVERHEGPPVHVSPHAQTFFEKYADDSAVYGPFIADDRYIVERPREHQTAVDWLDSDALLEVSHGAAIAEALDQHRELIIGTDLVSLLPRFATTFARHFDPSV